MSPGPLDALEQAIADALARTLPGVVNDLAAQGGPRAYPVAEVAERVGVSEGQVYRLIRAGRLRTVPYLQPLRISAKALEEFLSGETWEEQVS